MNGILLFALFIFILWLGSTIFVPLLSLVISSLYVPSGQPDNSLILCLFGQVGSHLLDVLLYFKNFPASGYASEWFG